MAERRKRRKRQKWKDGDLFLVPLADSGRVLGQALFSPGPLYSVLCAFTLRRTAPEWNLTQPKMEEVVAIQFVTCVALDFHDVGYWAVVGHAPVLDFRPAVDLEEHQARRFIGTKVFDAGILMDFLDACFALAPWDPYLDPEFFDKLLLSPDRKPSNLVL